MSAKHCPTCTCRDVKATDWPWCLSVLLRGHEAIPCYLSADHEGLHSSGAVEEPCAACGGVDLHRPDCPKAGETVPAGSPPTVLTWADDDAGVIVQTDHPPRIIGVQYRPDQWEFVNGDYRRIDG